MTNTLLSPCSPPFYIISIQNVLKCHLRVFQPSFASFASLPLSPTVQHCNTGHSLPGANRAAFNTEHGRRKWGGQHVQTVSPQKWRHAAAGQREDTLLLSSDYTAHICMNQSPWATHQPQQPRAVTAQQAALLPLCP